MVMVLDDISLARIADRVLLSGVHWDAYETMLREVEASGRHYRLTYADGKLEIALPTEIHAIVKTFVRAMLEAYLEEREIEVVPMSDTTWKHCVLDKGLEADECYYIAHATRIGTRTKIDLSRDPPPDLAIEVEATNPLLPKLPVYASLGVPEVWHIRTSGSVELLRLRDGTYELITRSEAVPHFSDKLIGDFVKRRLDVGHSKALRDFRQSLR